MGAYRWRRCPQCGRVMAAGELRCLNYGAHWDVKSSGERQCPYCGAQGRTEDFRLVRQKTEVKKR